MRGGFSIENQSVSFPSFALQLFLLLDHHSDGQLSRRFLAGSSMCWRNVRGDPVDQERTIARAIGASVNYFDTAVRKKSRDLHGLLVSRNRGATAQAAFLRL
jgi:hypothetical protein